jgi:RimJ/RimL family protein N-acetyltransferase
MNLQPILRNQFITLQPITCDDFDALYLVASDPLIWEQHPDNLRYQKDVFQQYFDSAIESKGAFLIIDTATKDIIGSSRYYELDEKNKQIAIGYTFIARKYWGTSYNHQLKKLMIDYAFQFVNTVILYIGENNIRSQKAIQKIGAIYFGKLNKSLVYTINKQDWILKYKG